MAVARAATVVKRKEKTKTTTRPVSEICHALLAEAGSWWIRKKKNTPTARVQRMMPSSTVLIFRSLSVRTAAAPWAWG